MGESGAVPGWAGCMKAEVCFVVGRVSFSSSAGVGEKGERRGHEGRAFQYFSAILN